MPLHALRSTRATSVMLPLVLVVLLGLLAGGCGPAGDEPSDGAQATPQALASAGGGDASLADAPAVPAPSVPEACDDAVRVIASVSEALAAVISGEPGAAQAIRDEVATIDEVLPALPEAIRDDVEVVARTIGGVGEDFAALELDPDDDGAPSAEAADVVAGLGARLQDPDYLAASEAISTFFEQGCPA